MAEQKRSTKGVWIAAVLIALVAGVIVGAIIWDDIVAFLAQYKILLPASQNAVVSEIIEKQPIYLPQTTQEEAVVKVVNDYSPAVVSVIITKNVPVYQQYYVSPFPGFNFQIPQIQQKGTQPQEVGAGSGFFVTADGMILTNKHVVSDKNASYTVTTLDGSTYSAKVLAIDPAEDVALIKIDGTSPFPTVKLGDSSKLQIGQTVIAIGNALGEFNNTVSVGVVSGLQRTITASAGSSGSSETLDNLIQTDAAINEGNSGGPLLNLKGEVIGMNTATAAGAQNIGFVIPINTAKRDIDQVKATGKITYPFLGISYVIVSGQVQKDNNLDVNYGAWISTANSSPNQSAVVAGSPAAKAGIKDGDIILEINGEKITTTNPLSQIIVKYNPGDAVTLKVMRGKNELTLTATLGERPAQ